MCGFCGVAGFGGVAPETGAVVRTMAGLIGHRGPDGEGFWDSPLGTLGHRRLAIIDVAGGSQPMFSDDGGVGIVFNGEIYNHVDLRRELTSHGHVFRTRSDTEVLVRGYEQWGDDFVTRLRGMFAFAILDTRQRRLLVARDRVGIKPFYYWHDGTRRELTFGSEIKALHANPRVPREPNYDRLPEYLLFRYIAGSETMFAGIQELQPGTLAVLDESGFRSRRYWTPSTAAHAPTGSVVEQGRALLADAVRSHLMSDVGIGTITSGGLDSSLVSAIAAGQMGAAGIDTFCVGFDDAALDERPYANQVARQLGTRHHDSVFDAASFRDALDRLTWVHDEPLSHPNAVAMERVFEQARHDCGIPVLLSGEGADEVFGGYGWYRAAHRLQRVQTLLGRRGARIALRLLLRGGARDVASPDYLLLANALGRTPELAGVPGISDAIERRRSLFGELCRSSETMFQYDQLTYLQPLLQRQDRMSMAVGVEARVPFLDHALVEWANSLRSRDKLRGGRPKQLLRDMAESHLPKDIIYRTKVGFALPLRAWLRGPLRERVAAVNATGSLSTELLGRRRVDEMITDLDRNEEGSSVLIWTLVALEVWQQVLRDTAPNAGLSSVVPRTSLTETAC